MTANSTNSSGNLHQELVPNRPSVSRDRPSTQIRTDDVHIRLDVDHEAPQTNALPLNAHQNADIRSLHSHNPIAATAVTKQAWRRILGENPFETSYFSLYRPLTKWTDKAILAVAVICSLAGGVPLPIIGVLFGKMINSFPPEPEALKVKLTQLLCVAVAYFCVTWIWATCWGLIGERVSRGLREAVLEKSIGMDIGWFEVSGADIAQRLTADTQTIQLGTSEKVGLFIQSIAYFLAAFITGFILNARLTGILFVAVIPSMAMVVIGGSNYVSKLARRASDMNTKGSTIAEGSIGAVRVVQAFGAADRLMKQYAGFLGDAARFGIWRSIAGAVMLACVYFVAYSANALAFWEGSRLVAQQKSDGAGTVYTVVFLILDASFVLGSFGPFLQTFALAAASGEKILEILDHPEPTIAVYSTEGEAFPEGDNDIQLENVTFVYPSRPTVRVLDGVSLNFPAGTVNALVGPSGSGKSTIAGLLLRFYDPHFGKVRLGNTDIKDINLSAYRSKIALVEQEPILFSGTILSNIQHGLLSRSDFSSLSEENRRELALEAARDANAYHFVKSLPEGFDTVIGGASSTQLSGGQKQRIALARALISDPRILVLDEPTSALDSTSEAAILDALARAQAKEGRTTIMIAHRLATVRSADKIFVMADGKLVEEGNHDDLMEKGGAYRDLVHAQRFAKSESGVSSSAQTIVGEASRSSLAIKTEKEVEEKATANGSEVSLSKDTKESKYTAGYVIRRCLELSRPDLHWIILGLCASIVTGGIVLGEAVIFGNLISVLNNADAPDMKARASFFSLMFFILALIALCAFTVSGSSFGIVSERLIARVREKSLRTILRQDVDWFGSEKHSASGLMSMLNMDAGHLSGLSGVILGTIFSVTTSMVGGIVLSHIVAWRIAVVLLAAVPVMLVSGFLRLRILSKFEERHQTAYVKAASLATEACGAMKTIQALGREQDVLRLYRAEIDKPYKQSLGFITFGNLWLAFALAITYFVYALAYWWGATNVRDGHYTTLDFFIVLPALLFSAQASGQMFSLAPEVTRAKTAAKSIFQLHDETPEIDLDHQLDGSVDKEMMVREKGAGGEVEFRDVCFHYASRPDNPILRDLSLKIQPGQFVGFVGSSGAGKSTTISLIERFYDPVSGQVLIDGTDIKTLPVSAHRSRLSLVSQEPCLFPGSIVFNVGLGKNEGNATLEEVQSVCRMVGLHDFIMSLPDGYSTECGTNGSQLSGGQKQRLSIARALMRDPSVLILDEATSALDSHSETAVQTAIAAASRGRTCVVVAHRLSTVQKADWIYVFEAGRVVEQGRHDELVRADGVYAAMSRRQDLA